MRKPFPPAFKSSILGNSQQLSKNVQKDLQNLCAVLDLVTLQHVLDIGSLEQISQIAAFLLVRCQCPDKGHPAIGEILTPRASLVSVTALIDFGKGERVDANLIAAVSELRQNIGRKHLGVAAGKLILNNAVFANLFLELFHDNGEIFFVLHASNLRAFTKFTGVPAALRSRVYAEHPSRVRVGKHLAGSVYGPV